jgi:uncharacterized protein YkwD
MHKLINRSIILSSLLILASYANSLENEKIIEPQKNISIIEGDGVVSPIIHKTEIKKRKTRSFSSSKQDTIKDEGLKYLNQLRSNAGMLTYSANSNLNISAYNHARYLMINNTFGHYEEDSKDGFSGSWASDRAVVAGYPHRIVGENVSGGNDNVKDSIDGLFSAIYHRFGFLDFMYDEIGIGADSLNTHAYGNAYNYNMGISQIRTLCEGDSYEGGGGYYHDICSDSSFKIEKSLYESTIDKNINANPEIVVWPYSNQSDSVPVFYEESPDPLPECSVSGYPISIQFNSSKVNSVQMQSFKLYYEDNSSEILDTKILDKESDPNSKFSDKEFALFPMQRLSWNTKYKAEFIYQLEDGTQKNKNWSFKTRSLSDPYYEVTKDNMTFDVKENQAYYFYVSTSNCNDTLGGVSYSGGISTLEYFDQNTVKIVVSQSSGTCSVSFNDGKTFTLNVSESDSAIYPDDKNSVETITLKKGWNLIGVNANLTLQELKSKIGENSLLVIQGSGEVYKKSNDSDFNNFESLQPGYGYWVKVAEDKALEYTPINYPTKVINLVAGWNLINPMGSLVLSKIKEQIGADNLLIVQGSGQVYKKSNDPDFNNFEKFEEPYGYWIKVASNSQLIF